MNSTQINQTTNASITTVVGSSILAATVGPGLSFSRLEEPVSIFLRLNEVSDRSAFERWLCVCVCVCVRLKPLG